AAAVAGVAAAGGGSSGTASDSAGTPATWGRRDNTARGRCPLPRLGLPGPRSFGPAPREHSLCGIAHPTPAPFGTYARARDCQPTYRAAGNSGILALSAPVAQLDRAADF